MTIGAGVAVCLFFVFSRNVNLITDAAVSLLDNFPISGSSTLHSPVQSLVGLQGMALRDQFYPNRVDAGMHLKWLMGFQRLMDFSPWPLLQCLSSGPCSQLVSLQTALTKEMFQLLCRAPSLSPIQSPHCPVCSYPFTKVLSPETLPSEPPDCTCLGGLSRIPHPEAITVNLHLFFLS